MRSFGLSLDFASGFHMNNLPVLDASAGGFVGSQVKKFDRDKIRHLIRGREASDVMA